MNKTLPLKKTVFFLCSPSIGILDNWLPVIWRLKEKRKDLKFVIVFPKANATDQINLSNVLIILSAKIFDAVVYKSNTGHWLCSNTFSQLKEKEKSIKIELFILKVIRKIEKWQVTKTLGVIIQYAYKKLYKYMHRKELFDWKNIEKHAMCILYDVYEELKIYNVELMDSFKEIPKFSIQHGINIDNGGIIEGTKKALCCSSRKDIKAYLFSPKEYLLYEHKYTISKKFTKVVGVPRHAPDWMELVQLNTFEQSNKTNSLTNNFIFLISRPGNTDYHPYERKRKALEDIKQLAWNVLKKKIVVKIHPKERTEGLYEKVFGVESYGDKWIYSDLHPFVLGKASTFAISFYSGVPIDMIALGVPTIEYLDLRGIPEYDNNKSLRDKIGNPVFSYRYLDLVLGVSDYDQMKICAMEIINNRKDVLARLKEKYNEFFPKIENINDKIAQDILNISTK